MAIRYPSHSMLPKPGWKGLLCPTGLWLSLYGDVDVGSVNRLVAVIRINIHDRQLVASRFRQSDGLINKGAVHSHASWRFAELDSMRAIPHFNVIDQRCVRAVLLISVGVDRHSGC